MDEITKAADRRWQKEQTWPLFEVIITGDEVEWVARPGVNEDEDGNAQPFTAPARASVLLRAQNEEMARAIALSHNPGYHTVAKVTQRKEE